MEDRELDRVFEACDTCVWYRDNSCWYYMPDSKKECTGKCDNFYEKSKI
jgi:hypothetical protein